MLAAVFAMAVACEKPGNDPYVLADLTIEADKLEIVADGNDYAKITVKHGGKEVTEGVDFYDASSNVPVAVKSMRFSTKAPGQHEFYATYNGVRSNPLKINALEFAAPDVPADPDLSKTSFRKRVLLTQFTSTGCTYCPIMTGLLRELSGDMSYSNKFVLAAAHADMNGYQNGDDPASFSGVTSLMNTFKVQGYPTLIADMGDALDAYDLTKLKTLVDGYYGNGTSVAGISANSSVIGSTLVVRVAVKAGETNNYRVGVWLLEDEIYGKQTSAPDPSYNTHHNCVRVADGGQGYMGYPLGTIQTGSTADRVFNFQRLDPEWKMKNSKLLIYVTSATGNVQVVNNAAVVPVGESLIFEYR